MEIKPKELYFEVIEEMKDPGKRRWICEREFAYFCMWYFSDYVEFGPAEFHKIGYEELKFGGFRYLIWMWFREAAKTTIVKMFIVWCICFRRKRFINYDCYEKKHAEANLFDVAIWLQTNSKLIADFGELFYGETEEKQSKKQAIGEFVTTNGVKVKAFSVQESTRGRIFQKFRPDLFILDDFENVKTKRSLVVTEKVIEHIDEMMSGLSGDANVIFLCNYLSDQGSVQRLLDGAKNDPMFRVHRVDVVEGIEDGVLESGKITWPDKYVFTDEEARRLNAGIRDKRRHKVSLEEKKRTLNAKGESLFEQEMLNQPIVKGDRLFNVKFLDKMNVTRWAEEVSDWKIWEEYKSNHRYGIGADPSEGVGGDSSAAVLIDFTSGEVVGTYHNKFIAPDIFAYELRNMGNRYGGCLVIPEVNALGMATLTRLRDIYENIYERKIKDDLIMDKDTTKLGFKTTQANKPEIMFALKKAVEEGELRVYSGELREEMRGYGHPDLKQITKTEGVTRHFDLLMAAALAWEGRNYATGGYYRVVEDKFDRFEVV